MSWSLLGLLPFGAVLFIYAPDVGHGFIKDDFAWIRASRVTLSEVYRLFVMDNGFYRPVVSLTFALNHWMFGLWPLGYGLTNLTLLAADAALLWLVSRRVGLSPGAALFASALWVLNPHGISMAVLWISGRTSLLLVFFALLTAWLFVRGDRAFAALTCLLAMLAKEEAVLLPFVLFLWAFVLQEGAFARRMKNAALKAWPTLLPLGPYLLMRSQTSAYLPATAPDFYRPSLDPNLLARNILEYTDRACTLAAAVLVVLWVVVRKRPSLDKKEVGQIGLGITWLVIGYGLTVFLPVRSSLYSCFPSLGAAIAASVVAQAFWRQVPEKTRWRLVVAGVILPVLTIPIYWRRNVRWVRPAELSARVLGNPAWRDVEPGVVTVLHDAQGQRANLAATFGTLIEEAVRLCTPNAAARVWIEPPPPNWEGSGLRPPTDTEKARHLFLRGMTLVGREQTLPSRLSPGP